MKKSIILLNTVIISLFVTAYLVANQTEDDKTPNFHKWNQERINTNTPCQNLDVLDEVDEIMHWEIIDDTLRIYTRQDSIRDEIERIKYIRSLDPEGWEE